MKDWKSISVPPSTTFESAILALDKGGLRIVLVVNEHGYLLGTLTDGDVRRALLRHVAMTSSVQEVMCATPQVAQLHWTREQTTFAMESKGLLQLPIVDAEGHVVGVETLHDLFRKPRYDNPVFLMAGGFGSRLRPLTDACPKPMLKIGNKPIIELILQSFIYAGFHRFYISTHYLPEMITDYLGDGTQWNVSIEYVYEESPLGTGGALGLLPHEKIDTPMFLMNADVLTRVDYRSFLEFHLSNPASATICVKEHESQVPYGVVHFEGHRITQIIEKPIQRFFVNAGIYIVSPEFIRGVDNGERVDMPTLLEREIVAGRNVNMFPIHESWMDIGRPDDFIKAQEETK
jgi:dTDP-glucose pyrophosphorylase/CBS domain-containing protein